MKKLILSIVVLFACYNLTFAQDKAKSEPFNKWEIGLNAGVANYSGEYNMYKDSRFSQNFDWDSHPNFGLGAFVKKNFNHVFALELGWNYSNLTGSIYKGINAPKPSFADYKTEVNEYDLNTVWNINNLFSKNKFDRKIYWFAKLGLGASHAFVKEGTIANGRNLKPTIPLGTGVGFKLSDKVRLNVGTQWSWINTDKLDGTATVSNAGNTKAGNKQPDIMGTKLYTYAGISITMGKKKVPEPVVEPPKPQPKPEPKNPKQTLSHHPRQTASAARAASAPLPMRGSSRSPRLWPRGPRLSRGTRRCR